MPPPGAVPQPGVPSTQATPPASTPSDVSQLKPFAHVPLQYSLQVAIEPGLAAARRVACDSLGEAACKQRVDEDGAFAGRERTGGEVAIEKKVRPIGLGITGPLGTGQGVERYDLHASRE